MISHNKYLINSRSMPQKEMLVVHAPVSNFEGVHGERKIGNPSPWVLLPTSRKQSI